MIEFKNLHIENFLSLDTVDLKLADDSGFILVDGENHRKEDAAASNGSGKTSIFEAIIWALTGETNRGYKDVVNRYQDEGCKVKLDFDFKGHSWSVERMRSKKGSQDLHLWKDGRELEYKGLRDAETVLSKELPELTMNFLGSTIILGQGLPQRFTNNTPAGRKAVLEELSNADYMISHIKENIKSRQERLSQELRKVEDEALSTTTKSEMATRRLGEAQVELDKLNQIDIGAKRVELEDLVLKGKEAKTCYEGLKLKATQAETNLSSLTEELGHLEAKYSEAKLLVEKERAKKLADENEALNRDLLKATEEFGPKIEEKKEQIRVAKENLEHKRAIVSGGYCKYCGQKLQSVSDEDLAVARKYIEENEGVPSKLEEELNLLSKEKASLSSEMARVNQANRMAIDQSYDGKLDLLKETFQSDSSALRHSIEDAKPALSKLKREVDDSYRGLTDLRSEYQIKKAQVGSYDKEVSSKKQTISDLTNELKGYQKALEGLGISKEDLTQRIKVVKSFDTFASRDFRGILLEDIVNQLDYNLHKYAEKVYGQPLTKFYQEGNSIGIQFDGKEYESLSGGEKQKLDVLVQLSLRDLIIQTSGIEANLVVFDEIFDALDQVGCEALLNVITDLGLTVYSITHRKELNIPYDKRLVVVKEENGIAHIEQG